LLQLEQTNFKVSKSLLKEIFHFRKKGEKTGKRKIKKKSLLQRFLQATSLSDDGLLKGMNKINS
jgi:hypothetical protein